MRKKISLMLLFVLIILSCTIASAGNVIDNTKKVIVYEPNVQEIYYDPIFTAMFPEYNLNYVTDGTISSQLTTSNCDLLLVGPSDDITSSAATTINNYLKAGGKVWFFSDPPDIDILDIGTWKGITLNAKAKLTVNNTDPITQGMAKSITSSSTVKQTYVNARYFTKSSGSGSGFYYTTLINAPNSNSLLVKYWSANGGRALYSNPRMFISGGKGNYFTQAVATKLFLNAKAWILGLDSNSYNVQVTYPGGDKQLALTFDDVYADSSSQSSVSSFIAMENNKGLTPANVNTFFIMPQEASVSGSSIASIAGSPIASVDGSSIASIKKGTTLASDGKLRKKALPKSDGKGANGVSTNDVSGVSTNGVSSLAADDSGITSQIGMKYLETVGDTHTLHPHFICDWTIPETSTATYEQYIKSDENIINNVMGVSDYGFVSFRFPYTSSCPNSVRAVINSGFQIDSSFGPQTNSGVIGDTITNNIFFVKQLVLNGARHNQIEMETPALYDLDAVTGSEYYSSNKAEMVYWSNINFPSVYVVSGHYQGAMTDSDLQNGLSQIITYANGIKDSTVTYSQIKSYVDALNSAKITAINTNPGVTVTVNCPVAIKSFTIKSATAITSVTLGSGQAGKIIKKGNNYYATVDLNSGSNTIKIK
jgi:hypothetical protein